MSTACLSEDSLVPLTGLCGVVGDATFSLGSRCLCMTIGGVLGSGPASFACRSESLHRKTPLLEIRGSGRLVWDAFEDALELPAEGPDTTTCCWYGI